MLVLAWLSRHAFAVWLVVVAMCFSFACSILADFKSPRLLHFNRFATSATTKKAPVVILHGLLGSKRNFHSWSSLLHSLLCEDRDIVCLDLRNHGHSSSLGHLPQCYASMAGDVELTLASLDISKCHLVGHSMGGKVAAASALRATGSPSPPSSPVSALQVVSQVLMDISPVRYQPEEFHSISSMVTTLSQLSDRLKMGGYTREQVAELIEEKVSDPTMRRFVLSSIVRDGQSFKWVFNIDPIAAHLGDIMEFHPFVGKDGKPLLRHGVCSLVPTLLLKGGRSSFVQDAHLDTVAALFPKYHLRTVRDAAHWVHVDQPQESATAVAQFILQAEAADFDAVHPAQASCSAMSR